MSNISGVTVLNIFQLQDTNYYSMAKTFAESVSKGEVKVKYEQETATEDQKVPF